MSHGEKTETDHRDHKHAMRKIRNDGNSLKEGAMQHVELLLGNNLETDKTTFSARQGILNTLWTGRRFIDFSETLCFKTLYIALSALFLLTIGPK
jgi:hypothetical protein